MQREMRAVGDGPHTSLSTNIRSAERRRYAAELMRDDVVVVVLTGMGGIGKTILARQIADRMRAIRPGFALTILDDFQPAPGDLEPSAGKLLITCREPLKFTPPHVISRHIGPLTRSGAFELMLALPRLCDLNPVERESAWRLVAGHPGALAELDRRLESEDFARIAARLRSAVAAAVPGGLPDRIGPTELPASLATAIAQAALAALRRPASPPSAPPPSGKPATGGKPPRNGKQRRVRLRWPLTITTAAVLLAALALASPGHGRGPGSGVPSPLGQARHWLATELAPGTTVACEPANCDWPRGRGVPSVLVVSGAATATRATATRAAATRAVVTLASFGAGANRVQVMSTAAPAAVRADQIVRRIAGRQVAGNPRLSLPAVARGQLAAGAVDARLLVVLVALLQAGPASVLGFADSGPGASPGVPLRQATIRLPDPAAARASLLGQHAPFRPARVTITGSGLLIIGFSAPSPLGLLNV